jgi:hypothetical protein
MEAIVAIMVAFLIALVLFLKTNRALLSFFIACLVMPAFVLYAELLLPHQGGGASMWQIALFLGGAAGLASAAIGIGFGFLIRKVLKAKKA